MCVCEYGWVPCTFANLGIFNRHFKIVIWFVGILRTMYLSQSSCPLARSPNFRQCSALTLFHMFSTLDQEQPAIF